MPIRFVIFDFDGTLADSFDWFVHAVNEAADRFAFRRLETSDLAALRSHGAAHVLRHVGLPLTRVPRVARFLRERMAADIAGATRIRLFDGVDRTLHALAEAGIRRAILTSNARGNVESLLGATNVARIDDWATGTALFGKAAKFRRLLRAARIDASETLYVGDETRDAEAARAAGLDFVGVAWGYTVPAALAPVSDHPLLERLDDLPRLVGIADNVDASRTPARAATAARGAGGTPPGVSDG